MTNINWSRVFLGGLLAGLIFNLGAWVTDGMFLKERWEAQMLSMGKAPPENAATMVGFFVWGFLLGIVAIWVYAAIRAQYRPGAGTAVTAGIMVWLLACALPNLIMYITTLFGPRLLAASTAAALVYMVVGTVLGAWVYKPAVEVVGLEPGVSA